LQFAQAKAQSKNCKRASTFATQRRISKFFSHALKKIKTHNRTDRHEMTVKLNNDNGLQTRTTERQLVTAVWRNGGCSASYDSFVVGSSAVLRLNFCAKNPPLRQAAKRFASY
jgi:hypothetical protein